MYIFRWLISCVNSMCAESVDSLDNYNIYIIQTDFVHSQVLAYLYVINTLAMCSLRTVSPQTLPELSVSIVITVASLYITAILTSQFASAVVTTNYTMNHYEYKIVEIIKYLKVSLFYAYFKKNLNTIYKVKT